MAASSSVCFMEMVMRGQELHQKPQSVFTVPVLRSLCNVYSVVPSESLWVSWPAQMNCLTPGERAIVVEQVFFQSVMFLYSSFRLKFSAKFAHFPGVCFNVAVFCYVYVQRCK